MMKRLIILLIIICFITAIIPFGVSALADSGAQSLLSAFDSRNVFEDLMSSSVNGEPFDLKDYPYDNSGTLQLINFVEYCYSFDRDNQTNYGLYLYIYNPQALNIIDSELNKVQLASVYNNFLPVAYEKWNLKYLSKSTGDYNNLFYKFRVDGDMSVILSRLNSNERRYDISGIELVSDGQQNAVEYNISGTYKYRGYVAGMGPDPEASSTIEYKFSELETISLNVEHTYFRSNTSSLGAGHQNELNSVYFAVPGRYIIDYGNLKKIKAEWWEYKTKMIVALSKGYNLFVSNIGVTVPTYDSSNPNGLYGGYKMVGSNIFYDYTYNMYTGFIFGTGFISHYAETKLPILLSVDSAMSNNRDLDPDMLADYIYSYNKSYDFGKLSPRNISADLFVGNVDLGRKYGYNLVEIEADYGYDLLSYDSNHSWWDKFVDFGFTAPDTGGDFKDVKAIYEVKASDLIGSDSDIAKRLLISERDVSSFKSYYASETVKGNKIYLFRYALTDYFSQDVYLKTSMGEQGKAGFRAQGTVFLDFDIISLTFSRDGVLKVIPVVMSPFDIINAPSTPQDEAPWVVPSIKKAIENWGNEMPELIKSILIIVSIVLGFVILLPVLPSIFKFLVWLISLPFKLIMRLIDLLRGVLNEKKQKKYL